MKRVSFALILGLVSIAASRATTVTYVGTTTSNQQPGSSTDFIDFWTGDYNGYGSGDPNGTGTSVNHSTVAGSVAANLNSFTIQGGVSAFNTGDNGYTFANITTPLGQNFTTGMIEAGPGIAFAITPGIQPLGPGSPSPGTQNPFVLNSTFNYNDFLVYLMFSNTNGAVADTTISIDQRTAGSVAFGLNDQSVSDNTNAVTPITTGPTTAQYLEFEVKGLGDALAANPGTDGSLSAPTDLVVDANFFSDGSFRTTGQNGYIGGVSFVSLPVPEPSSYAMFVVGGLGLLLVIRRSRARLNS